MQEGTRIGDRYEVVRAIGSGGIGCVFEARHHALGKVFAVKLIRLDHWSNNALRRFEREAQALARIDSPRVVQVTDYGVDDTVGPYLVMERLQRQTLRDFLRDDPQPDIAVVRCVADQVRAALDDIHQRGLVHRDVKPSNIAIDFAHPVPVKLIDLGLAVDTDTEGAERVTASHEMVGSMPYMAPELFSGKHESPASDLWSLGVVLAEMLSGKLPFDAPSSAALIHQITSAPIPELPRNVPSDLVRSVKRLLAREPARRLETTNAEPAKSKHAQKIARGLALFLLVGALLAALVWRTRTSTPSSTIVDPETTNIELERTAPAAADVEPEKTEPAYADVEPEKTEPAYAETKKKKVETPSPRTRSQTKDGDTRRNERKSEPQDSKPSSKAWYGDVIDDF